MVLLLGLFSGSSISVKARAVLPYDNNAHPRILQRVFWSTVFSPMMDTAPYREIRIMQGRGNDKNITGRLSTTPPNKKPQRLLLAEDGDLYIVRAWSEETVKRFAPRRARD